MAAWYCCASCGAFSHAALRHSAKLALASYSERGGQGARRAADNGREKSRGRVERDRRFDSSRAPANFRAAFFLEIPVPSFSRDYHWHVQPALGHQRHSLLSE